VHCQTVHGLYLAKFAEFAYIESSSQTHTGEGRSDLLAFMQIDSGPWNIHIPRITSIVRYVIDKNNDIPKVCHSYHMDVVNYQ
jgi:hypothetical protein